MHALENRRSSESSAAAAIRAVEAQMSADWNSASYEKNEQRKQFFSLLDRMQDPIFDGVAAAAAAGKRRFYLGTTPRFDDQCDKIFNYGLGQFDVDVLTAWLFSRDLSHIFRASTKAIEW